MKLLKPWESVWLTCPKVSVSLFLWPTQSSLEAHPSQKKSLSNQIIGIHLLIGQLKNIVEECGDPEGFDAAEWLGTWAFSHNDALGGHRPADYFDTVVGQQVISNLLSAIRYGIYQ